MLNLKVRSSRNHLVRFSGVLLLSACLFFHVGLNSARAQFHYTLGVGGKVGSPWVSGSVKYFMGNSSAIEGLLHFGSFGVGTTVLYEYHFYFPSVPGLRLYVGGGGHIASNAGYKKYTYTTLYGITYEYWGWNGRAYNPFAPGHYSRLNAGIDAVIGVEYVFEKIPLALAVDVTPLVNFPGVVSFWWNTGVTARYTFKKL